MTEDEENKFKKIVESTSPDENGLGDYNYYDILGLVPFTEYIANNYTERYNYSHTEISDLTIKNKAKTLINKSKAALSNPRQKKLYDAGLKPKLERKIIQYIKFAVKDNNLDDGEEEGIYEEGLSFGLSRVDIRDIIDLQQEKLGFKRGNDSKDKQPASPKPIITTKGQPVLEIVGLSQSPIPFHDVKIGSSDSTSFTVKNGGGGSLDAIVRSNAKWLTVSPTKIHQSHLPQLVTLKVDPSLDFRCKLGFSEQSSLSLTYNSNGNKITKNIKVELIMEGHEKLVGRLSGISTAIAAGISGLYLFYLFNTMRFSGWPLFGMIISLFLFIRGLYLFIEKHKTDTGWWSIGIGAAILLVSDIGVLLLFVPIPLTWWISKPLFSRYPLKSYFAGVIPISLFLCSLLGFQLMAGKLNLAPLFLSGELRGTIIDKESREPLPGANILIEGTKFGASTDVNGRYYIENIPQGNYNIKVTYIGYEDNIRNNIGIKSGDIARLNFELEQQLLFSKKSRSTSSKNNSSQIKSKKILIKIVSVPKGADVYISGQKRGKTPLNVSLNSGYTTYSLKYPGYKDYSKKINISPENQSVYNVTLEPKYDLKGIWTGTFSDKKFTMIFESINGSSVIGYDKVKWTENSEPEKVPFRGTFNQINGIIDINEQGDSFGIGKFTGKISSDGKSISGTWTRLKRPTKTYNWSVRK